MRRIKPKQTVMHCRCGREPIVANGECSTCYALRRQDEAYFGGHREAVLKRDGHRCRVPGCMTVKRGKRSLAVHHRDQGNNDPTKMITLCPACHAKVTRTLHVQDDWPELLRELWREQHPQGHEQTALDFRDRSGPARNLEMFEELKKEEQETSML